jgi:hypothetical protein
MPTLKKKANSVTKDQDLENVRKEEGRRGRRPIDLDERRKALKRLEEMRKLLMLGTEEEFREAMRVFGIRERSKEFEAALAAWREFRP